MSSMVKTARGAMLVIAISQLFAMSLWFGISAVAPQLQREWSLSASAISAVTLAVQLGFVSGTLTSAILNVADIVKGRTLIALCALTGAIANASLALFVDSLTPAIVIRFFTGFVLAGVYPPGMKLIASWFKTRRGLALGSLVGALTLGKASPYVINAIGSSEWRTNALIASALAAGGGLLVLLVDNGPYAAPAPKFDWHQVTAIFRNRGVRLASFGYFGHMWELYAMWTWFPIMLRASVRAEGTSNTLAEVGSFVVIAAGAIGCVVAGLLADRSGRTLVASAAMIASGSCCILVGLFFDDPLLLVLVAAIWGATVVADSAQFSACVTELSDPAYVGTALTTQTSIGFLLTTISIELTPLFADAVTWRYAFILLAPGPILGTWAMLRLRQLPEAARLAQGRR